MKRFFSAKLGILSQLACLQDSQENVKTSFTARSFSKLFLSPVQVGGRSHRLHCRIFMVCSTQWLSAAATHLTCLLTSSSYSSSWPGELWTPELTPSSSLMWPGSNWGKEREWGPSFSFTWTAGWGLGGPAPPIPAPATLASQTPETSRHSKAGNREKAEQK